MEERPEEKWLDLIEMARSYWVDNNPTGVSDKEYDRLEAKAAKEGFFVRDYVFDTYLKGTRTANSTIEKIKKMKAEPGQMFDSLVTASKGKDLYISPKYDGSSLAIYLDPSSGRPKRVVTSGNLNLISEGVDQTWKLLDFLPDSFPKGIEVIQAEGLVNLNRYTEAPERARQKANGLINSTTTDRQEEVNSLLTLRAFRYYLADTPAGKKLKSKSYPEVLSSLGVKKDRMTGRTLFAPADVFQLSDLKNNKEYLETGEVVTSRGKFLADGWVLYSENGECIMALKHMTAGTDTEGLKTTVRDIIWNDQSSKGKDSWSANVLIDPIQIQGSNITKPSAGSVGKLVRENISVGAEVGIILANSVIPMVSKVFKPGNGDFKWPTCECGYKLGPKDTYSSLLKCGRELCSVRIARMKSVLNNTKDISKLNLDKFLVIDRMKFSETDADPFTLFRYVETTDYEGFWNYLRDYLTTDLQRKNLDLIWRAAYQAIADYIKDHNNTNN